MNKIRKVTLWNKNKTIFSTNKLQEGKEKYKVETNRLKETYMIYSLQ